MRVWTGGRKRAAATLLTVAVAAGCGNDDESRDGQLDPGGLDEQTEAAGTTDSLSPSTEPEVAGTPFSGSGQITNSEGYQYTLQYEFTFGEPESDPLNDDPGFTSILAPIEGTWIVTNDLSDRRAPFDLELHPIVVVGLFRTDRPVCQLEPLSADTFDPAEPFPGLDGERCLLEIGAIVPTEVGELRLLEPGATRTGAVNPVLAVTLTDLRWRLPEVPEAQAAGVVDDIARGPDETAVIIPSAKDGLGTWRTPFGPLTEQTCLLAERVFAGQPALLFLYAGTETQAASTQVC